MVTIDEFRVGDRVACIGETVATHAEYNAVPRTLVARVPINVSLEAASSSAVAAIALQGMRQARLELGMSVAVIGLGLLGQFLVQLCRANGCRVMGVDLDPKKCELALPPARRSPAPPMRARRCSGARRISHGAGVDVVLLTTSTKDNQPVEMAACLSAIEAASCVLATPRSISTGACGSARRSNSFSAARLAPASMTPTILPAATTIPIGYVRWSAKRNMTAYLDLLAQSSIDPSNLITHRFAFDEAVSVFNHIASGEWATPSASCSSIPMPARPHPTANLAPFALTLAPLRKVRLGMIGAGNYAKSMLLPHFHALKDLSLVTICTARGMNAEAIASAINSATPPPTPEKSSKIQRSTRWQSQPGTIAMADTRAGARGG